MLEPNDRLLLFEALRPPEGFRFDQGIGTTYTLDLLALLTAPLAFTWFEQQDEEGKGASINSLEILESLRRHADGLTLFCHAGRICLPKAAYPQLAFIEESVVECALAESGAFHPKAWVLRWINDAGSVRYRVLCLSRNLAFSRAWDTLLTLDGQLTPDRRSAIARNRPLADFVRALPGFARTKSVGESIARRVQLLASELERTELELPDGLTDLRFWPVGIGGRLRDPLAEAGDRLLVVSPFITLGKLEELAGDRKDVTLVSTASSLACLSRKPQGVRRFYSLIERATIEADSEHDQKPESDAEAVQLTDLHAKLYVSERGRDAHIWTGSANATDAAFTRNVELLVELVGPRKRFGIDALMTPQKGEVRFINLLEDAGQSVGSDPKDPDVDGLERRLEEIRGAIAAVSLEARVTPAKEGSFNIELVSLGPGGVFVDADLTLHCWPVTVASSVGIPVDRLEPDKVVARFGGLSFQAITSFMAFELAGRAKGEPIAVRFVLNVRLVGAPEGRREKVLRSLVQDRSRMMRFLWLLLADEGIPLPEASGDQPGGNSEPGRGGASAPAGGLFEMLLRNLDRAPERLDHLSGLLKELRHGADGEDLLPAGFDAVWEPIWRQRERLRSRTSHESARD